MRSVLLKSQLLDVRREFMEIARRIEGETYVLWPEAGLFSFPVFSCSSLKNSTCCAELKSSTCCAPLVEHVGIRTFPPTSSVQSEDQSLHNSVSAHSPINSVTDNSVPTLPLKSEQRIASPPRSVLLDSNVDSTYSCSTFVPASSLPRAVTCIDDTTTNKACTHGPFPATSGASRGNSTRRSDEASTRMPVSNQNHILAFSPDEEESVEATRGDLPTDNHPPYAGNPALESSDATVARVADSVEEHASPQGLVASPAPAGDPPPASDALAAASAGLGAENTSWCEESSREGGDCVSDGRSLEASPGDPCAVGRAVSPGEGDVELRRAAVEAELRWVRETLEQRKRLLRQTRRAAGGPHSPQSPGSAKPA